MSIKTKSTQTELEPTIANGKRRKSITYVFVCTWIDDISAFPPPLNVTEFTGNPVATTTGWFYNVRLGFDSRGRHVETDWSYASGPWNMVAVP